MLTGTSAILTGVSHGFPQSVQENAGIISKLGNDRFLPYPFEFIMHPTIPCSVVK
jgi:hypothetical protein